MVSVTRLSATTARWTFAQSLTAAPSVVEAIGFQVAGQIPSNIATFLGSSFVATYGTVVVGNAWANPDVTGAAWAAVPILPGSGLVI